MDYIVTSIAIAGDFKQYSLRYFLSDMSTRCRYVQKLRNDQWGCIVKYCAKKQMTFLHFLLNILFIYNSNNDYTFGLDSVTKMRKTEWKVLSRSFKVFNLISITLPFYSTIMLPHVDLLHVSNVIITLLLQQWESLNF